MELPAHGMPWQRVSLKTWLKAESEERCLLRLFCFMPLMEAMKGEEAATGEVSQLGGMLSACPPKCQGSECSGPCLLKPCLSLESTFVVCSLQHASAHAHGQNKHTNALPIEQRFTAFTEEKSTMPSLFHVRCLERREWQRGHTRQSPAWEVLLFLLFQ